MSFFQMSQAVAPFTLMCLFYFFYRLNRFEKFLIVMKKNWDAERVVIVENIDTLTARVETLEGKLGESYNSSNLKDYVSTGKGE